jgi:hypothetical protein
MPTTDRPEDIPSAMREAFANHRTASAWNLIASAGPAERLAALLGFERLLGARGLVLADVATAMAAIPAPAPPRSRIDRNGHMDAAGFRGFGGVHSKSAWPTEPGAPGPAAGDGDGRRIVKDVAVPETVIGRIRIRERRPTSGGGEMLLFTAETENEIYGPLASFAGPQIAHLVEAERSNWIIRMMIERTHSDRIMPKVRRLETV